jgi:putative Mg2+ transporter-C (MgtC) family protein
MRTHILVCLGATLTTMIGFYTTATLGYTNDPLRIAAQVVSGIGFLGVGTILLKGRFQITGLTTAAGLWATGSIGLAIGIGFYIAALLAFLIVFLTITLFIHLEKKAKKTATNYCYVELFDSNKAKEFCDIAKQYAVKIDIVPAKSGIANHIGLEFKFRTSEDYESLLLVSGANEDVVVALPLEY